MNKPMKKMLCLTLVLALVLAMAPTAQAARMAMDGRKVLYGTLQAVPIGQEYDSTFRAARDDENGIVYIQGDDLATILGAGLVKTATAYEYSLGNWEAHIRLDKGTATVCYDFEPNEGSIHGRQMYDEFNLTDCLHDELNDEWYFPFEEVMYMLALQWLCIDGTVYIYQPETLLDILCESEAMRALRPHYEDLMGDKWWQQWGNSFKWGVSSSLDELDMTFLWNGAAAAAHSAAGEDYRSQYETDVLTNALLRLQNDIPSNPDDAYIEATDTMETFVSAVSGTADLSGEFDEVFEAVNTNLQKCLHVSLTPETMKLLTPALSVGSGLINYALDVGQTVYIRDNLPESFSQRLKLIEETADARRDEDPFYAWLADTASSAYDTYYGPAIHPLTDSISLDMLANLVDNTLQMGGVDLAGNQLVSQDGGIQVLRWMNLAVSTIDLGIEIAANVFPPFGSALEKGENAHLCRYLIYISSMMDADFAARFDELKLASGELSQDLLNDTRTSLQLLLSASLHSADLLTAIDKQEKPAQGYPETACLYRLTESAKYDKLLLMDPNFSDIVSEEEGCMRQDIPVEYVRIIEPVIVTTETTRTESDHYYSSIIRPRVYSMANEKLGAAVDKVLDPIFEEAFADVKKDSQSAAACTSDMGTHHTVAYLTAAYSNGGFLSLALATGYFSCSIGHNVLETTTYVFDVASGALLDLPDLLNTKENPQAEAQLIELIDQLMDETGTRYTASHDPSPVTAQDMYEEMKLGRYAHWDIAPDGIYVSIEALNMNVMIHGLLIPFDRMEGILKEAYLPPEASGSVKYEMRAFTEDMLEEDSGIQLYDNAPGYNAMALNGLATQLWIDDGLGRENEPIDGGCAYFYGFGVQNCLITLPEPLYAQYGYEIAWIDGDGDHVEAAPLITR